MSLGQMRYSSILGNQMSRSTQGILNTPGWPSKGSLATANYGGPAPMRSNRKTPSTRQRKQIFLHRFFPVEVVKTSMGIPGWAELALIGCNFRHVFI